MLCRSDWSVCDLLGVNGLLELLTYFLRFLIFREKGSV